MNVTPQAWEELNCRLEAIEAQRNNALTDHAVTVARLRMTATKLAAANAKAGELEKTLVERDTKILELETKLQQYKPVEG